MANSGVTAGAYGSATSVPSISVDAKGRVTSATNTPIQAGSTTQAGILQLVNDLTTGGTGKSLTAEQGKILNAQDFGVGQTWQNLTASRVVETSYTNTTGKLIIIKVYFTQTSAGDIAVYVNGFSVVIANMNGQSYTLSCEVPAGAAYKLSASPATINLWRWAELR
ncbi:hypothetical protein C9426_00910 [Serratia sp. S1B]|nr:hypothetical protein C9426_00910 [Serratia sp. S1B]